MVSGPSPVGGGNGSFSGSNGVAGFTGAGKEPKIVPLFGSRLTISPETGFKHPDYCCCM